MDHRDVAGDKAHEWRREEQMAVPNLIEKLPKCYHCSGTQGVEAPGVLIGFFYIGASQLGMQAWCPNHGNLLVAKLETPISTARIDIDVWTRWQAP